MSGIGAARAVRRLALERERQEADSMQSKTDQLRQAWMRGDRIGALRIASRFFDRSVETKIFRRGWDASQHPDFYRQVGKDPAALTDDALRVMAAKFNLPG